MIIELHLTANKMTSLLPMNGLLGLQRSDVFWITMIFQWKKENRIYNCSEVIWPK